MAGPSFFTTDDGIQFILEDTPFRQIVDVPEYRFSDIGREDRVLDIGANAGAFCLRAARMSRAVTAVEPVTAGILTNNIRLNHAEVRIIEGGLGDGSPAVITWDDTSVRVPTYPLGTLVSMAGGCDFLKCDCEGAEWKIRPRDLDGIRRIEMELHLPPICGTPDMALIDTISRYYDFEIERKPCHDVLGVMGILHAERR
jgi:FkbM family methyltransferase